MDLRQIWSFQCRPLPSLAVPGGGDRFGGDNRGDDISNGGNRHLTARELFMRRSCHWFVVWFFKNFQRMCCKKSIVFFVWMFNNCHRICCNKWQFRMIQNYKAYKGRCFSVLVSVQPPWLLESSPLFPGKRRPFMKGSWMDLVSKISTIYR